jgi:hypothetical protein
MIRSSQDKVKSPRYSRACPPLQPGPFCSIYGSWLERMMSRGGPTPMEGVAWALVRAHGDVCPICREDVALLVAAVEKRDALLCRVGRSRHLQAPMVEEKVAICSGK